MEKGGGIKGFCNGDGEIVVVVAIFSSLVRFKSFWELMGKKRRPYFCASLAFDVYFCFWFQWLVLLLVMEGNGMAWEGGKYNC